MKKDAAVDDYISGYPPAARKKLKQIRAIIQKTIPEAEEVISYNMPAYKLHGMLAWFGGHSSHVGFYPGASGIAAFKKELAGYKNAKGSVQFPYDQPLPETLIIKILRFKEKENNQKKKG